MTSSTKPEVEENRGRVPDCSEVGIFEFNLVNRSLELVNSQFELGPDRSSPTSELGTRKNELGNSDFRAVWNAARVTATGKSKYREFGEIWTCGF